MGAPGANVLPNVWEHPPPDLALREGEVHLWRAQLDLEPAALQALEPVLSEAEREKAARFYFQKDRGRYIASKACQRAVLGAYLGRRPDSLTFCVNPYGKPGLSGESGGEALQFNLSHTRELGVLAVARGAELGVDVERVRIQAMVMEIGRRFFSPQEVAALEALPAAEQNEAFYLCWTRKEAYIKARGEGLSFPLDQFSVSLAPDQPPALLSNEIDPAETRRWHIYHLEVGPGYASALAIESLDWAFKQWEWLGSSNLGAALGA